MVASRDDFIIAIRSAFIKKGNKQRFSLIGLIFFSIGLLILSKVNLPVTNCPAVNQTTVAEHVFALLLSYVKNIIPEHEYVQQAKWKRLIGKDIGGKTLGVMVKFEFPNEKKTLWSFSLICNSSGRFVILVAINKYYKSCNINKY